MILLLDIGNSRIKWAFLEKGELKHVDAALCSGQSMQNIAASYWADFTAPKRVLVVNVLGQDTAEELSGYVSERWGIKAEFIKAEDNAFGITNAYSEPARLGADRWVAMVAAFKKTKAPVCVIDCGTALTVDVVTNEGKHMGGMIIPGLAMMRQSLINNTEGVLLDTEDDQGKDVFPLKDKWLAKNTHEAVIGGTLYTLIAMIDRVVMDLADSLGMELNCFITGGDAKAISPLLSIKHQHEPNLVLEGLAVMAESS